jgi:hypothetical protein
MGLDESPPGGTYSYFTIGSCANVFLQGAEPTIAQPIGARNRNAESVDTSSALTPAPPPFSLHASTLLLRASGIAAAASVNEADEAWRARLWRGDHRLPMKSWRRAMGGRPGMPCSIELQRRRSASIGCSTNTGRARFPETSCRTSMLKSAFSLPAHAITPTSSARSDSMSNRRRSPVQSPWMAHQNLACVDKEIMTKRAGVHVGCVRGMTDAGRLP